MGRWGVIGLLDVLKESAMLTGCFDCFQSMGSREVLDLELLLKCLLLCIYGMGTNMGLKRMAGVDPHIKEALGKPINWEAITQQYDMMVKYANAGPSTCYCCACFLSLSGTYKQ